VQRVRRAVPEGLADGRRLTGGGDGEKNIKIKIRARRRNGRTTTTTTWERKSRKTKKDWFGARLTDR
jgi:hypothetical protein